MATGQKNTYGLRRRFSGRTGVRKKSGRKWVVLPRSNGNSGGKAKLSWESGQTVPVGTKFILAKHKVQIPKSGKRPKGFYRNLDGTEKVKEYV